MTAQLALDLPGITVKPTPSMRAGTTRLVQCGHCGVAMAVPGGGLSDYRHDDPLGPCPRCGCETWWRQTGANVGPFHRDPL